MDAAIASAVAVASRKSQGYAQQAVRRKMDTLIGDGVALSITTTHNYGTRGIFWALFDATTHLEIVPATATREADTLTLTFGGAPGVDAYHLYITD